MQKVNVSTKQVGKFAGKWVAIDFKKERIVAVGETLKEIRPLVTHSIREKPPKERVYSFKVPRRGEGPYVLCLGKAQSY